MKNFKMVELGKQYGTSFHGTMLLGLTKNDLISVFGKPYSSGDKKVKNIWIVQKEGETNKVRNFLEEEVTPVITIYDWKLGKFKDDDIIIWNIGMHIHNVEFAEDLMEYIDKKIGKKEIAIEYTNF